MEGVITHAGVGVLQHRNKTDAINWLRSVGRWKASEFSKGREDVDRLGKLSGRTAWLRDFRKDNQNRNVVRLFVVGVPGPDTQVARVKPVITPQDGDRVVSQSKRVRSAECGQSPGKMALSKDRVLQSPAERAERNIPMPRNPLFQRVFKI